MQEVRCKKCNKLLGYIDGKYEIKCPRCGEMNKIDFYDGGYGEKIYMRETTKNVDGINTVFSELLSPQISKYEGTI